MFVFGLLRLNIFPHVVLGHLFLALITIINIKNWCQMRASSVCKCFKWWFNPVYIISPFRLRRYRIRAGSAGDTELMTCLAQLMRGGTSRSSSLHSRSSPQHVGTRLLCFNQSGISHHHHHHQRSSSASPRSCSSLQRSISSSPSRHEHRVGCLRSHSPPSFSGSPPFRRAPHTQEGSCGHKVRTKACSREPKWSNKLSR